MSLRVHKSKTKKRHRLRLKSWPFTFSPFARALARLPYLSMARTKTTPIFGNFTLYYPRTIAYPEDYLNRNREVVQADFSFFDPKPSDFHGAKLLMQNYLDDVEWDVSAFVDLILAQTTVGTVVKVEENADDGIFGLVSVLSLSRYGEHICIHRLKDYLFEKALPELTLADQLGQLLRKETLDVGIIISQRVVNLPLQLLPHLYEALFDEVAWATEDEPTQELRDSFKFKHYIILSKIYVHKYGGHSRKMGNNGDEAPIIYMKPEDEIFRKLSSFSYCFPLNIQPATSYELRHYRSTGLVMAVSAEKIPRFREEVAKFAK